MVGHRGTLPSIIFNLNESPRGGGPNGICNIVDGGTLSVSEKGLSHKDAGTQSTTYTITYNDHSTITYTDYTQAAFQAVHKLLQGSFGT